MEESNLGPYGADVTRFIGSLNRLSDKDWIEVHRRYRSLEDLSKSGQLRWGLQIQAAGDQARAEGFDSDVMNDLIFAVLHPQLAPVLDRRTTPEQSGMIEIALLGAVTVAAKAIALRDWLDPRTVTILTSPFNLKRGFVASAARGRLLGWTS